MRRRSVVLGGLLFATAAIAAACSEPSVPVHIESVGTKLDSVAPGSVRTFTAMVQNQNHDGMEGVDVVWTLLSGEGTLSTARTSTGKDGLTSVTFTAPATAGITSVSTAGIEHLGSAVQFMVVTK
jgi:hypothetical protein